MLNTLADIADAMAMRKHVAGGTVTGAHPADNHYSELKADLDLSGNFDIDFGPSFHKVISGTVPPHLRRVRCHPC